MKIAAMRLDADKRWLEIGPVRSGVVEAAPTAAAILTLWLSSTVRPLEAMAAVSQQVWPRTLRGSCMGLSCRSRSPYLRGQIARFPAAGACLENQSRLYLLILNLNINRQASHSGLP